MPRIGREIEQDRGITRNVHCAECGYNLRTRPVVGRCPECGGQYDSRPLGMRGILQPRDIRFPFDNFFLGLLTLAAGLGIMYTVVVGRQHRALWAAIPLLIVGVMFLYLAVRQTAKRSRFRALIKRAEAESDE